MCCTFLIDCNREWLFPCGKDFPCMPITLFQDGIADCPNGFDEDPSMYGYIFYFIVIISSN